MSVTARQARKIIKDFLDEHRLPYEKVSARTVDFTDLARTTAIFVKIEGWKPDPIAKEIRALANEHGFHAEFSGPGIID